ncbi:MAG: SUMF1/EgtB/PvdO family nonheme iron enzyme [Planctomycetes bacterium]|nr:SUMF1/EgtB/PvdO family nonheme iron enzyme [Planctomycetota bacterium]
MSDVRISSAAEAIWLAHIGRELAGERVDFHALCDKHPGLRAEFESLRQAWESSASASDDSASAFVQDERLRELLAGLRLATPPEQRFELRGELGRGGMGVVTRVWDPLLRRELALKTSSAALTPGREQEFARFVEEAQILAQLDHPSIVPLHEIGLDRRGRPYFLMKLVEGRDLRAVLALARQGSDGWSTTRVLALLLNVCEAVGHAHAKGVLHRDLKPSNIMVGAHGEPYVMDWGIARVSEGARERSLATVRSHTSTAGAFDAFDTAPGAFVGTAAYMSPEQAGVTSAPVDARTDVYAVGAILYELLAGHAPFAEVKRSSAQVLEALRAGPALSLALRAPDAPAELLAICERAMARDVAVRYADLSELAAELRAYMEGRVVRAHRTGVWVECAKWVRRNRALAAALAVAALVAASGAGVFVLQAAELERRYAEVTALADSDSVDELLQRADKLWPPTPALASEYERWLADARGLVDGRGADPARAVRASPGLAAHRATLERLRRAAKPLTPEQIERDRRSHPDYNEFERAKLELEWRLRRAGRVPWPDRDVLARELAPQLESARCVELLQRARALFGAAHEVRGREVEALLVAERAVDVASDRERADAENCRALALVMLGRWDEAEHALELCDSHGGSELFLLRSQLLKSRASWLESEGPSEQIQSLQRAVEQLESRSSERATYEFEDSALAFAHRRYAALVAALERLGDPLNGPASDAALGEFGWGIAKRLASLREAEERSLNAPSARALWAQACDAVGNSPHYGGLELRPQFGLLPLGPDPRSGLWEFAYVPTGATPQRDALGELICDGESAVVLVLVPGGTFTMGAQLASCDAPHFDPDADEDEGPPHEIELAPFFLAKFELTWEQWRRLPAPPVAAPAGTRGVGRSPVCSISWSQCEHALGRIGLDLPTEAQWEYAARRAGAPSSAAEWRSSANLYDRSAAAEWMSANPAEEWDDGFAYWAPVGSFAPNALGLHDLLGNVFELCRDDFGSYAHGVRAGDGLRLARDAERRVVRGGAYGSDTWRSRVTCRMSVGRDFAQPDVGVRPALALAQPR